MKKNYSDDEDFESGLDDELKLDSNENKKILGNTLDFYNEELSRKVVGGLFDPDDFIVSGYDKEDTVKEDEVDESSKKSGQERKSAKKEDYDFYMFAPRGRKVVRKKTDANAKFSEEEKFIIEKYEAQQTDQVREERQEKSKKTKAPKKQLLEDYEDEDEYEDYDENETDNVTKSSFVKIAAGSSFIIVMIILAWLTYNINTIKSEYNTLLEEKDKFDRGKRELEQLTNEVKVLTEEKEELTAINEELKKYAPSEVEAALTGGDNAVTGNQASTNTSESTYTVLAGDNLSKISNKFYGTRNDFQKIIDANNLKTEVVFPGQVLKIPK